VRWAATGAGKCPDAGWRGSQAFQIQLSTLRLPGFRAPIGYKADSTWKQSPGRNYSAGRGNGSVVDHGAARKRDQ